MAHGYHKSRFQCLKDKILHPKTKYERVTADELNRRLNSSVSKDGEKKPLRIQIPKVMVSPSTPLPTPGLPKAPKDRYILDDNTYIWDGKRYIWDKDSWDWIDTSLDGIPENIPLKMECGLTIVRSGDYFGLADDEEDKAQNGESGAKEPVRWYRR